MLERDGKHTTKKTSLLLASAVSALAGLASSASTASVADPALRVDQHAARGSPTPANTIRVSQAAKDQIGTQAKPGQLDVGASTLKPGALNPGAPKEDYIGFVDQFHDQPHFRQSLNDRKAGTQPAGQVQKTFQKNRGIPQQK